MTYQEIKVDALGRPVCAYDEKEPVSLRVLGKQRIERFSRIVHDEDSQEFVIVFDTAAPDRLCGTCAFIDDFLKRGTTIPVVYTLTGTGVPMFRTYAEAVQAERALLSAMMRTGEL